MSELTTIREYRRGEWYTAKTFTAACARRLIAEARGVRMLSVPSKLNPSLTVGQGLDVLERGIAQLTDDAPVGTIIARNILSLAKNKKRADLDGFLDSFAPKVAP